MQPWLPHLGDGVFSGEVGFSPGRFASEDDVAMVREASRRMVRTVLELDEAGVPIHTGSDANAPNIVPGASLHRDIELLARAARYPPHCRSFGFDRIVMPLLRGTLRAVTAASSVRAAEPESSAEDAAPPRPS